MTGLLGDLLTANSWAVYLIVGFLVFAEDALFVGFVIPGETAAVLGGVAAYLGHVNLTAIAGIVVLAAIVGDSVGFEVGRHFGPRILQLGPLAKHQHRLADAQAFLRERGGAAVFLGRFVAFFRATMPALAGISRMHYPKFLRWNAFGGIVWGITFVCLGYFAGTSYQAIEHAVGRSMAVVVAIFALAGLIIWRINRGRVERAIEAGDVEEFD